MRSSGINFSDYEKVVPEHKKKIDFLFLCWFIGFSEADGSFVSSILSNGSLRNFFFITQKDPKVLYFIKKEIGFGRVRERKDGFYQYYVSDHKNIDRLIRIFNGNLHLEKSSYRLKGWFAAYLKYTKIVDKVTYRSFEEFGPQLSLNNAWFSGFIDGEGCFNVQIREDYKLKFRFTIS